MRKWAIPYRTNKTTFAGKALAAAGWTVLFVFLLPGILLVTEEFSLAAILAFLLFGALGTGGFLGLQAIAALVEIRHKKKETPASQPFCEEVESLTNIKAAGRVYLRESMLTQKKTDREGIYRDCYGRTVVYIKERFPCFDEYDLRNENRYFHWYYIRHDGRWTQVYTRDDRPGGEVTENLTEKKGLRSEAISLMAQVERAEAGDK